MYVLPTKTALLLIATTLISACTQVADGLSSVNTSLTKAACWLNGDGEGTPEHEDCMNWSPEYAEKMRLRKIRDRKKLCYEMGHCKKWYDGADYDDE